MSKRWSFRWIFSRLWSGVDGVRKVMHLLVLLFIFSILIEALSSQAPSLPAQAALVIRPVGDLVDQLAGDPYDRALQELLGEEKPQTVAPEVSAEGGFVGLPDRIYLGCRHGRRRAPAIVVEADPEGPVESIPTGFRDRVDDAAGETPVLGGHSVGQDRGFLDGVLDEDGGRLLADGLVEHDAIHRVEVFE